LGGLSARAPAIVFVLNTEWYFLSHRVSLARALKDRGFRVVVAAPVERGGDEEIRRLGFSFVALPLRRRSLNPFSDLVFFASLVRLYLRERPDLVHHLTIKPVIWGSLAARLTGGPAIVDAVPGLGWVFADAGRSRAFLRRLVLLAYRVVFAGGRTRVVFQQEDDLAALRAAGVVTGRNAVVIRGSGVDPDRFRPAPEPAGEPAVLMAARLLWDKGVGTFVEAVRLLKGRGVRFRAVLAGMPDAGNPDAVPESAVRAWERDGLVEWSGWHDDAPALLASASVVVLPSAYPEGIPKILLEAAACGRPVVTTDRPGCRDAVVAGETGLLVPPRDPAALADALAELLADAPRRRRMGERARAFALSEFSDASVVRQTFETYASLLADGPARRALAAREPLD